MVGLFFSFSVCPVCRQPMPSSPGCKITASGLPVKYAGPSPPFSRLISVAVSVAVAEVTGNWKLVTM